MRLLLPGGRGGAGLSSLRRLRLPAPGRSGRLLGRALALPGVLLLLAFTGCAGKSGHTTASTTAATAPSPPHATGAALGLTEDNAQLLWNPAATGASPIAAFVGARGELTALHPTYIRLLVDWARVQPSSNRPPALEQAETGCVRNLGPCAPYPGIAGELAAIASQQRADPGSFQVVLDLFGTPPWAAAPKHGCERTVDEPFARPIASTALPAYRTLIADLLALGRREGVELPWWSPWNEPNDPRFITPQRSACTARAPVIAADAYAQLARAMAAELKAAGPGHELLLGELGGFSAGAVHLASLAEFVAALPADVLCLSHTWAVHAYAVQGRGPTPDPVGLLEGALASRGGCAAGASIWVTESGAGAPEPGKPRLGLASEERGGCEALARQVSAWEADRRVHAIFQFSFRDDPAFPVGLISSELSKVYPVYGMWLALAEARADAAKTPPLSRLCP